MAKITKREAKRLSILKWQWLYDNPDMGENDLHKNPCYEEFSELEDDCGLCHYHTDEYGRFPECKKCILHPVYCEIQAGKSMTYYHRWARATTSRTRKKYAGLILEKIKEW